VLIWAFEVPADADERFIAAWEELGLGAVDLHRALRADVTFRFVAVGSAELPRRELGFESHRGLYSIVHQDGAPDGREGVKLINAFEVPAGQDDALLTGWGRTRDVLATQRGYLGTRLHRSVTEADFRFVNIARWSSPLAFARALKQPAFAAAGTAMPFASHPALYLVVSG
jgi:heme-degrading monooxygenase HmoA